MAQTIGSASSLARLGHDLHDPGALHVGRRAADRAGRAARAPRRPARHPRDGAAAAAADRRRPTPSCPIPRAARAPRCCARRSPAAAAGAGSSSGIALGAAIKLVLAAAHLLPEEVAAQLGFLPNASLALKIAPALLAVGFIVGFRAASVMVAGGLISRRSCSSARDEGACGVGASARSPLTAQGRQGRLPPLRRRRRGRRGRARHGRAHGADDGAARSRPCSAGAAQAAARARDRAHRPRPARAASSSSGSRCSSSPLATSRTSSRATCRCAARIFAALGVALFGFLFVPVSSRLVGVIGVSSNPTSAMALHHARRHGGRLLRCSAGATSRRARPC